MNSKKSYFGAIALFLYAVLMANTDPAFADVWMNNNAKYHISYVDYQTSGFVNFAISESSTKLFVYNFSPTDTLAFSKAKTLLSVLLAAKLTGKEITILIPGDNPTVSLTDGAWQNYIGIGVQ